MSLSCSNIIKAKNVNLKGVKTINNLSQIESEEERKLREDLEKKLSEKKEEINIKLQEAQKEYDDIIDHAKAEASQIIEESKLERENIEKKAYEEGYNQGLKNGYEDGYKESYEENIEKAKKESEEIVNNASKLLIQAKDKVSEYMNLNKEEILKISISIAQQVLRDEFKSESSMNTLLTKIIEEHELKENIVIKINPLYKDSLNNEILNLKECNKLKGDVFVLEDESIDIGNAIIENVKGRIIVGVDAVIDKVKEELL